MSIRKLLLTLLTKAFSFKSKAPPPSPPSLPLDIDSTEDLENWLRGVANKEGLDAQYKWIREHKAEIQTGKQLIKREMNVSAQLTHIQNLIEEQGMISPSNDDLMGKYETELSAINDEYMEHRERLSEVERYRPPGRISSNYLAIHTEQSQPQTWIDQQYLCQLYGGCCARDCGCCEQNLRSVRVHLDRTEYLHCPEECACCERHRAESNQEPPALSPTSISHLPITSSPLCLV